MKKYKNIEIIEKGAWNKYERLLIQDDSEHGASAVNGDDGYAIEVDCIDNCIDENVHVTHIKMDIEGGGTGSIRGRKQDDKDA